MIVEPKEQLLADLYYKKPLPLSEGVTERIQVE
jgi:hypothetical protein